VRTWFLIDLFSILPFDLVALLLQSGSVEKAKSLKFIRLLRLLKMTRMLKASRIYRRLEAHLSISYEGLALNYFFVVLIFISHWLACLWALTLTLTENDNIPQWVDSVTAQEGNVADQTKDSIWKLYVASLYFTAYTITSVGYGDITPQNILERVVCVVILFVSGISWACVIGQMIGIVGNMDHKEQEFRRLMDNLNRMMIDRGLPRTVCRRLRKFFLSAKQAQKNEQEEQILHRMSPDLQGEVVLMSHWPWVSQVSFIKHIMPDAELSDVKSAPHFVVDIALSLSSAIFAQSEVFGVPRVLYVLRKGLAVTRVRGWIKIASTGSVWGEDFVLSDFRLRDPEARLALTYIEVYFLEFKTFVQVVERHRLSNPELEKQVRRFTARLSARRAILAEARWRRYHELEDFRRKPAQSLLAPTAVSSNMELAPSQWRSLKAEQSELVDHKDEGWELDKLNDAPGCYRREDSFVSFGSFASREFTRLATPPDRALMRKGIATNLNPKDALDRSAMLY